MGRSIMCSGVPLFICFAVLATLINAVMEIEWKDGIPWVYNRDDKDATTPRPLYEKDGFLAGEETPVWFADFHNDKVNGRSKYSYRRLSATGTPMVKKSLNYWNSSKKGSGFPIRKIRSTDDRENLTYTGQLHDALRNERINRFDFPSPVEKRSTDSNNVVYPSVLVVMNYDDVFPTDDKKTPWTATQLVLYALAFWGTVDSSLRNIENPRVSLRIAGIVITTSRKATPYLTYNAGEKTFVRALSPMIDYWRSASRRTNSDFPLGSYDIVAHMTDICPWSNYIQWTPFGQANNPILGVASKGPPCKLKDQIGGVIISDDLAFLGIHRAIAQMSKVLGGSDETPRVHGYPRRRWSKEMLDPISNALKDTSCMSAPKEHYRPGTPVSPILAGELMPNGKQCELADYMPNAWTCWDTNLSGRRSDCHFLKCSNQRVWGVTCSKVGLTLDGSFCNKENTKICLDGKCVNKK